MYSLQDLQMQPQSAFRVVATLQDLIASDEDAIYWVDPPENRKGFLQDVGRGAYIYKLHNAVFYPDKALLPSPDHTVPAEFPILKSNLKFKADGASLLLTQAGDIFSESFKWNKLVPAVLASKEFRRPLFGSLPDIVEDVADPSFFCEFFTSHFGHVLIDMLGRFWPLTMPEVSDFLKMNFVGSGWLGFRNGNLGAGPNFFYDVMSACGLDQNKLVCIAKPTRFSVLYVPSRIAPYFNSTGPRYHDLMRKIGLKIAGENPIETCQKVFLSRSKLGPGKRALCVETEILVEDLFAKRGFDIVHPQDFSLAEQIAKVRDAKWLAGLVGSQMHLAVFSNVPAPKMFRIAPTFHRVFWDIPIMQSLGGNLHDFVAADFGLGAEHNQPWGPKNRSWDISPADLHRLDQEISHWLET